MALQGAHQLFGDTDESSCVPDAACAIGMPGEACKLKASQMPDAPSSPEAFPWAIIWPTLL